MLTMIRQDKLIILLDTGTSSQVRRTAAKQLAELTVKTFRSTTRLTEVLRDGDIKPDVKPDVIADESKVTLSSSTTEEDAWNAVLETISKLLPLLRSKSSETRHATAIALGLLAQSLPPYTIPVSDPSSSTSRPIVLASLLKTGDTLLASAGREYIAKPSAGDKSKRRKEMMGSLGLMDGVGWGDDVENVIGEEDDEMNGDTNNSPATNGTPKGAGTPKAAEPKDIFEGLSARQVTMLKRKKGNIAEEANK
jgi:TATA-binding protein-associated factor